MDVHPQDRNPAQVAPHASPRKQRPGRLILLGLVLLAGLWLGLSLAVAWRLTRRAAPRYEEPAPAVEWGKIESLRLETRDGLELGGWLVRGNAARPCALVLHGNGDSRRTALGRIEALARAGFGVLAVSLRAHGDSSGELNDFGFSARADVVAAAQYARKELPGRKLVILAQSLGAAAALFAAKELDDSVSAYALESPYSNLRTAVRNRTEIYLPWGLDIIAYTGLELAAHIVLPIPTDQISPAAHVADIPVGIPVLFLAGMQDRHTRIEEIEAMASSISSHSRIVRIEGAAHSMLFSTDPALYMRSVFECFEKI